jgi:TusE/DsrC/DsvC family sulfur relay protein
MGVFRFNEKEYRVDAEGFLCEFGQWDEDFALGMAPSVDISGELTRDHWNVIYFIHDTLKKTGRCPLVYETCQELSLTIGGLKRLFPAGYLRGACKLAGITYKEGYVGHGWLLKPAEEIDPSALDKTYPVNVRGFLVNSDDWDEHFAVYKAYEMNMSGPLTEEHWQIIYFLRDTYKKEHRVPTVYDTCEAVGIDIKKLEELFPNGYHRGAVKIAGLMVR